MGGYVSGDYGLLPEHENIKLESPTSVSMKNSFIIKTSESQKFEHLYRKMMARRKSSVLGTGISFTNPGKMTALPSLDPDQINLRPKHQINTLNKNRRPPARDGHTAILVLDNYLIVFGGDRH